MSTGLDFPDKMFTEENFTAAHLTDVKLLGLFLNDFCSMQFYSKQIQMLHKNVGFCFL